MKVQGEKLKRKRRKYSKCKTYTAIRNQRVATLLRTRTQGGRWSHGTRTDHLPPSVRVPCDHLPPCVRVCKSVSTRLLRIALSYRCLRAFKKGISIFYFHSLGCQKKLPMDSRPTQPKYLIKILL